MKRTLYFTLFLLGACATSYTSVIKDTEKLYYSGNYSAAIPKIRSLATESSSKDRLLYMMEAGMIMHTQGDYEKSNMAFKDAEAIADTISVSVTKSGLSFLLSDNESNFTGEDFERVLIKFYIALNYIFLGQYEDAKIYFRRLDVELREMKYAQAKYKQNMAARYLDAILSEALGRNNDARVQYRNISEIAPELDQVKGDRYVLAVKENDSRDMAALSSFSQFVHSMDQNMNPIPYRKGMGEVVIINQAGKAATKESRGKIMEDPQFAKLLRSAVDSAARSKSQGQGLSVAGVLATMGMAENPVPIYKIRDPESATIRTVRVNGRPIGRTTIFNDYSETAMKNFNDNYNQIVIKNVASIAIKMVAAVAASEAATRAVQSRSNNRSAEQQALDGLLRMGAGALSGYAVSKTIAPDLRSWRLLPSNYQIKRLHLLPGQYTIDLPGANLPDGSSSARITVEEGKPVFLNYRSFKPEAN